MDASLGIDIGGTRIRVGVVARDGRVLARVESLIPEEGEPVAVQRAVATHVREVLNVVGAAAPEVHVQNAGVALPGVWDPATWIMRKAVNLPRLEGVDLRDLFEHAIGGPVLLEADANAAIWGQYQALTPRPQRLVFISLGTGIGGGVILDGAIVRMTRGGAGHFGFLIVDTAEGAPAGRNNVPGCLSAIASGPALHQAATGLYDPRAIGQEPLPDAVLNRAAKALAVAFIDLVHIFAPEVILLGGGVIDHHPTLVERASDAFGACRSSLIPERMQIRRAPLTTHEAGVIGVALLALETRA